MLWINTDPDPAIFFISMRDPDPGGQDNADPDSGLNLALQKKFMKNILLYVGITINMRTDIGTKALPKCWNFLFFIFLFVISHFPCP